MEILSGGGKVSNPFLKGSFINKWLTEKVVEEIKFTVHELVQEKIEAETFEIFSIF